MLGVPVDVPPPGEYVALGAARQAAWVLAGGARPPHWTQASTRRYEDAARPGVREQYARARDLTVDSSTES